MCVCVWQLNSLKESDSIDAVDCGHRTQKKKKKRAFGFMLTAEKLNGVFLRSNRSPML